MTPRGWMPALGIAAGYLILSLIFTDYRPVFEFNPDEGNNLIKALLLAQGQSFSGGIWSDQPPLFSYALLACFKLFGMDVGVARTLVLATSAVLVFALYDSVRMLAARTVGPSAAHLGATIALASLLVSARFAPLRVAVMIGLPSIAMLALALWAALAAGFCETEPKKRSRFQVAAGVFLALSLAIKLFTLFVAPIVYATLLAPEIARRRDGIAPLVRATGLFAAGLVPTLLVAFAPVFSWDAFRALFAPHVAAQREIDSNITLGQLLAADAALYVAVIAALPLVRRVHGWTAAPWFVWWLLATALLAVHNPLWGHHSFLMVVPAAGLLGLGASALVSLAPRVQQRLIALTLGAATILVLAFSLSPRVLRLYRVGPRSESRRDREALAAIRGAQVGPGNMVTARQIFAFYLERPVPVQLSVTSVKRLLTGGVTLDQLAALIGSDDTQLVLLSDRWPPELRDHVRQTMQGRFERLYEDSKNGEIEVWRRRD